jgi:hypothetical protein
MYTDIYLFIAAGLFLSFAVFAVLFLIISGKKARAYRKVLEAETEIVDVRTITAKLTESVSKSLTEKTEKTDAGLTVQATDSAITDVSGLNIVGATEILKDDKNLDDFNSTELSARYAVDAEIQGGGMGRVFLARNIRLGNKWIIKFIPKHIGELANEADIMKHLNHPGLPQIIDVCQSAEGVYLVQTFIDGVTMDDFLATKTEIPQPLILDWFAQLAQALNYLHTLKPSPICHFDMKPSNIMITHDNRVVIIDFGISRRTDDDSKQIAVTYEYAAPEQLAHKIPQRVLPVIAARFGKLPDERGKWKLDARTDLYSLGVILFEASVGTAPTVKNSDALKHAASPELCEIIMKCVKENPKDRYQSAQALLDDLRKVEGAKARMANTLLWRRIAAAVTAASIITSGGTFGGGYYVYARETSAAILAKPEIVTVSLQASSQFFVDKELKNGRIIPLQDNQIRWDFSADGVARVDGGRVSGLNVGTVELTGRHRNKAVSMEVRVVPPMNGIVNISQRYAKGRFAERFTDYGFYEPSSIDIARDGTVYIADAGVLTEIRGGVVRTLNLGADYLTAEIVRCFGGDIFVKTGEWQDGDEYYFAFLRVTQNGAEIICRFKSFGLVIEDFAFSADGTLYFIERNAAQGMVTLNTLDTAAGEVEYAKNPKLPEGTAALTVDGDSVYLANEALGVIMLYRDGQLSYFAGIENEREFIDGLSPRFYSPQKIEFAKESGGEFLYIWDFNTLRRLQIIDGAAGECETFLGVASPVFERILPEGLIKAENIILPYGKMTDFAVGDNGILITDPKRGVIWRGYEELSR